MFYQMDASQYITPFGVLNSVYNFLWKQDRVCFEGYWLYSSCNLTHTTWEWIPDEIAVHVKTEKQFVELKLI